MNKFIVGVVVCVGFLTGCAAPAPDVVFKENKYAVNVKMINVMDLTTPNESASSIPGYLKMGDNISNPPFSVFVYNSLKNGLKPIVESKNESLDVMLLNANLLIKINTVDYIPLISIASALSNRDQLCSVGVNLKIGTVSVKRVFENKVSSSQHFTDLDTESKKQFLENCVNSLVDDVAKFANEMVSTKN